MHCNVTSLLDVYLCYLILFFSAVQMWMMSVSITGKCKLRDTPADITVIPCLLTAVDKSFIASAYKCAYTSQLYTMWMAEWSHDMQ